MSKHDEEESPEENMATAADCGGKPLQNAMKMAKVAIQLDGGSKHKVEKLHAALTRQHTDSNPEYQHGTRGGDM